MVKESACNAGDPGSIPERKRSCGEGNGHPLQYSWLENSVDRGAWWGIVHGVSEWNTTEQLPRIKRDSKSIVVSDTKEVLTKMATVTTRSASPSDQRLSQKQSCQSFPFIGLKSTWVNINSRELLLIGAGIRQT